MVKFKMREKIVLLVVSVKVIYAVDEEDYFQIFTFAITAKF